MKILQAIWKATEVERYGFKEWWTNGSGGELRFIGWGLIVIVMPIVLLGLAAFFVYSFFR